MADGRRLRGLEVRVVRRERRARRACVPGEGSRLVDERVVELAGAGPGGQPERHPKRLAARTSGAQPTGGGPPDAALELGLAGVEGVPERRVPGKLLTGDRVQLEQPPEECLRVVAR